MRSKRCIAESEYVLRFVVRSTDVRASKAVCASCTENETYLFSFPLQVFFRWSKYQPRTGQTRKPDPTLIELKHVR